MSNIASVSVLPILDCFFRFLQRLFMNTDSNVWLIDLIGWLVDSVIDWLIDVSLALTLAIFHLYIVEVTDLKYNKYKMLNERHLKL